MGSNNWNKVSQVDAFPHGKFLTFDIDWAEDFVLSECIDLVQSFDVCATWFVTHDTPLLSRIRNNDKFELGIHPNFNNLIDSKMSKSAADIVRDLLEIVPEAKSIRSHSLTQSSRLRNIFLEAGILYDCNHYIPYHSKIELRPWKEWDGLTKVPHFWADDIAIITDDLFSCRELLAHNGIKVFDFHPIHIFLNTEQMSRYERARNFQKSKEILGGQRNIKHGVRDFLCKILSTESGCI